jgi:hypothetical protein
MITCLQNALTMGGVSITDMSYEAHLKGCTLIQVRHGIITPDMSLDSLDMHACPVGMRSSHLHTPAARVMKLHHCPRRVVPAVMLTCWER